jgi:ribosomal-protein-alanine N-acetyltransferase
MSMVEIKISQVDTMIRAMRIDDLAQVQAIDEMSFSTPWPKNAYRYELLENPNGYCWVAEVGDKLVGVIVCWLIVDEVHIATIAVNPEYRGMGIGKQLVIRGLQELISKGALSATLEVRAGNTIAQNLYYHFGFKLVGERKNYYKDNFEDALLLTVDLLDSDYLEWLVSGAELSWLESHQR